VSVEDLSPLTEIAPKHPDVLEVFSLAWLNYIAIAGNKSSLSSNIDQTIQQLVSSFKGTDSVTLLAFLGHFIRSANQEVRAPTATVQAADLQSSQVLPPRPKWLKAAVAFIPNLVASRPTADGRHAYTTVAAALLQTYPSEAPPLLFAEASKTDKPFSYLFINLLLIDLRSSFPSLLEQLNKPEYTKTARRLASAFDIVASFIGFLVRSMDDESLTANRRLTPPDLLLKLRKGISETMSVTIEFLRDRWDASVAGAMGLHPDARIGAAETSAGSRLTLPWDSMKAAVDEDPLILSAVRALAIWLREDDNEGLRMETTGLLDMFMDLYRSSSPDRIDFRSPILVALEGLTSLDEGVEALLRENGWEVLTKDLLAILLLTSTTSDESEAARGIEIVRLMLPIAESEESGSREEWMGLATAVAAWDCPDAVQPPLVLEFQVAMLQLVTALMLNAHDGMKRRYRHTAHAIQGIRQQLERHIGENGPLRDALEEVCMSVEGLEIEP
jgi:hypothetical protein